MSAAGDPLGNKPHLRLPWSTQQTLRRTNPCASRWSLAPADTLSRASAFDYESRPRSRTHYVYGRGVVPLRRARRARRAERRPAREPVVFPSRALRAVRTANVIAAAARGSDPRLPSPFPSSAPHPSSGPRARPSDPRPLLPRSPLRFIPRITLSLSTPRLLESTSSASPLCPTADTGPLLPSVPLGTDQLSYRNSSVPRDGGLPNPLDLTVDRVTDASRLRGCFQRISAVEPKGSSVVTCYCTTFWSPGLETDQTVKHCGLRQAPRFGLRIPTRLLRCRRRSAPEERFRTPAQRVPEALAALEVRATRVAGHLEHLRRSSKLWADSQRRPKRRSPR